MHGVVQAPLLLVDQLVDLAMQHLVDLHEFLHVGAPEHKLIRISLDVSIHQLDVVRAVAGQMAEL